MLATFHKAFAHPPEELHSPDPTRSTTTANSAKLPHEILRNFRLAHPDNCLSVTFARNAAMACVPADRQISSRRRLFCCVEEVYCMFLGSLENLNSLLKQYGLSGKTTEALFVIEAYRTLRDRGPYPADQVIKELSGSFGFVVYDNKNGTIFAALSSDGGVPMFWGIAADGSTVVTDEMTTIKGSCGRSFAPFPTGCLFHSEGGLRSFEHPMNRMKAMPRVDSEGIMCGATFKVDYYSRINTMPRVGSSADWTMWNDDRC